MNCKPGDLAVVVGATFTPRMIGRIVKCIRVVTPDQLVGGHEWFKDTPGPTWEVESTGDLMPWGNDLVRRRTMNDRFLRPIRDPGDDARDESLSWLPVPSREEVSA